MVRLLTFTVDGHIPGDEIQLTGAGGTVEVNASVKSIVPIEKLELYFNGKVIASSDWQPDPEADSD